MPAFARPDPLNAVFAIVINSVPVRKVMLVKIEQPWNAVSPMLVTLPGMTTELKIEQLWKAANESVCVGCYAKKPSEYDTMAWPKCKTMEVILK